MNASHQDSASAPTTHHPHPCPYVAFGLWPHFMDERMPFGQGGVSVYNYICQSMSTIGQRVDS